MKRPIGGCFRSRKLLLGVGALTVFFTFWSLRNQVLVVLQLHQREHHQHHADRHPQSASMIAMMLSDWSLSSFSSTNVSGSVFLKVSTEQLSGIKDDASLERDKTRPSSVHEISSQDNDFFAFDLDKSPPFAIFHNIYIPKNEESTSNNNPSSINRMIEQPGEESKHAKRAKRIFREQMRTIGSSYANSFAPEKPVTVYYNTIGDGNALNASYVHLVCTERNNMTCRHMQHYDGPAFEDVTLQLLYDFCHYNQHHDDLRVVYIHSKGSYRKVRYQNDNRRIFTRTVTSRACLDYSSSSTAGEDDCNVCGHNFQPVWGPFFGGNFWVARCSYIRQLIPPRDINRTMTEKLQSSFLEMQQQGKLLTNLLADVGPYALGTGRYSHEHWVAGHASLRPCDIVEEQTKNGTATITKTTRRMAPREPIDSGTWYGLKSSLIKKVLHNKPLRLREYFLLPGYLYRQHILYPEQGPPPGDSWIWRWFPDGEFWKNAVETHGGIFPALTAVTVPLASSRAS